MLTPKLIPMEKMEQLEKASKEQQDEGLRSQTPDWKEPHAFERVQHTHGRTPEAQEREAEIKSRRSARGRQTSQQHRDKQMKEALEIRDDDPQELMVKADKVNLSDLYDSKGGKAARAATPSPKVQEALASHSKSDLEDMGRRGGTITADGKIMGGVSPNDKLGKPARNLREGGSYELSQKQLETQRLDDAAVQLEKIFGFRDRKKKDPKLIDYEDRGGARSRQWARDFDAADKDKKRVARQRQQVKDVAAAPGKAAGKAAGAAAGAAYDATGAAERGTKRAGSLLSRAFGAGKRKAQDIAGAPGRRQERKTAERHQSNLRQQATDRRVAASEDRRDARRQSPKTVQEGRSGYTNGHDTGLGGGQGERSAAIPKYRAKTKAQQADSDRGAAAARAKAASYKSPRERAAEAKPSPSPSPSQGGRDPLSAYKNPPQSTGGRSPSYGSGAKDPLSAYKAGARSSQPTPKQQPTKVDPTKPVWGQNMEKAVISLQKYVDDCGCEGDSLMQNARSRSNRSKTQFTKRKWRGDDSPPKSRQLAGLRAQTSSQERDRSRDPYMPSADAGETEWAHRQAAIPDEKTRRRAYRDAASND
jgi:hypothetical protein